MALSLGIKMGSVFIVGGKPVEVLSIGPGQVATLKVADGKVLKVTDKARVEAMPEVYVSLGPSRDGMASHRLAFEAPRSISIVREEALVRK